MEFSFSQKFKSLIVSFDGFFRSCLLESSLVTLTAWKDLISSYFFVLRPFISRVANFAQWFLRKGVMEPALLGVFLVALQLDHAPKYSNQVWGWGYMKEDLVIYKELFSCRIFGISKLFLKQKSFWHWFKANSFCRNSSDSYEEVFRSDENFFVLILMKMWSDIWLVTKGWNLNLRVNENRVSTKMWRTRNDIWLVIKRFKFQFEG